MKKKMEAEMKRKEIEHKKWLEEEKKRKAEQERLAKIEAERIKKEQAIAEQKRLEHERDMKAAREQLELANKDFDDSEIASYALNLHHTAPERQSLRTPELQSSHDFQIEVQKLDDNTMHPHATEAIN